MANLDARFVFQSSLDGRPGVDAAGAVGGPLDDVVSGRVVYLAAMTVSGRV